MQGNQTFTDRFRVLVAGGGTGNSVCFMGEQLRDTNAEVLIVQGDNFSKIHFQIVYLDFSPASLAIAEQRVNIRQVENVQFVLGSIEQLPALGLGEKCLIKKDNIIIFLF